jgi:hypothetical protein
MKKTKKVKIQVRIRDLKPKKDLKAGNGGSGHPGGLKPIGLGG